MYNVLHCSIVSISIVKRAITIGEQSRKEAKHNTNNKAKNYKRAIRNKREKSNQMDHLKLLAQFSHKLIG